MVNIELCLQLRSCFLAFTDAVIIGGVSQAVLFVGGHNDDFVVAQVQWQVVILQSRAVKEDSLVFLGHVDGKLVHDPGRETDKFVFGLLAELSQLDWIDFQSVFFS